MKYNLLKGWLDTKYETCRRRREFLLNIVSRNSQAEKKRGKEKFDQSIWAKHRVSLSLLENALGRKLPRGEKIDEGNLGFSIATAPLRCFHGRSRH